LLDCAVNQKNEASLRLIEISGIGRIVIGESRRMVVISTFAKSLAESLAKQWLSLYVTLADKNPDYYYLDSYAT
jgi:K+-sensing histidine kinase KdpD